MVIVGGTGVCSPVRGLSARSDSVKTGNSCCPGGVVQLSVKNEKLAFASQSVLMQVIQRKCYQLGCEVKC